MLTATIEFASLRNQWMVCRYGQKGWTLHQGVPCFFNREADAIAFANEFLGA